MKRFLARVLGLAALCAAGTAHAVPSTIGFSGRLVDDAEQPAEGEITLRFSIHDQAEAGPGDDLFWQEDVTVFATQGRVFATLGETVRLDDNPIIFGGGTRWLEVTVVINEEDTDVLSPRLPLLSVPYALQAGVADVATHAETADRAFALDGFDPTMVQRRTGPMACGPGSSIRSIDANGNTVCHPDRDTTYTAGPGIALDGNELSVNALPCDPGYASRYDYLVEGFVCDVVNSYSAGTGLLMMPDHRFHVAADECPAGMVSSFDGNRFVCVGASGNVAPGGGLRMRPDGALALDDAGCPQPGGVRAWDGFSWYCTSLGELPPSPQGISLRLIAGGKLHTEGPMPMIWSGGSIPSGGATLDSNSNDVAGTVIINSGPSPSWCDENTPCELFRIQFASPYQQPFGFLANPTVIITAANQRAGSLDLWVDASAFEFSVRANSPLVPFEEYEFNYIVVGR